MDELMQRLAGQLASQTTLCHFELPYSDMATLDLLHTQGNVIETIYGESQIRITVEMDATMIGKYRKYLV
jgi:50S ribosomal subunit-associated GTPase HflX